MGALAAHLAKFGPGDDGLVFHRQDGRPLSRDRVGVAFKRAARAADAPPNARLHDLRHYYASLLIGQGASVRLVQANLGHASAKETLDTYAHFWPNSDNVTRAAVDSVLGVVADSLRTDTA